MFKHNTPPRNHIERGEGCRKKKQPGIKQLLSIACLLIMLFILCPQHVAAQQGTIPCGLNYKIYKSVPERIFKTIDSAMLRKQSSRKGIPETVGFNFKTHFTPTANGDWRTILPGIDSWFLKLRSNEA